MSTARTTILLALTAATVAVPAAAASAAAQSPAGRPHSRVVTYDRGGVLIRRLQMAVTRSNHRLHATVQLTVRNDSGRTLDRELQIGRCTSGSALALVCPATVKIPVRLPAHQQRRFLETVTLRQPSARTDSVQAALVAPGTRQPFGPHTDGSLLLRGGAWRGAGAGRTYGVVFGPLDRARRLNFDIPVIAHDRAYIDVRWQGPVAPAGATTTISRCGAGPCTATTLRPARRRSGPQDFDDRFDFTRGTASSLALSATTPEGFDVLSAELPWPA